MGDHQRCTVTRHAFKRLLYDLFAFTVQRTGRLIEQKHGRIPQDGARNRQALALTTRKRAGIFSELGVIALRERHDKVVGIGRLRSGDHLAPRRFRAPEENVVRHTAREERRILLNDRQGPSQLDRVEIADIHPVQAHTAGGRIVKTKQKLENCTLAGARWPDQGYGFPR